MSLRSLLTTATLAFFAIQAAARCRLENKPGMTPILAFQVCDPQDAGTYTFALEAFELNGVLEDLDDQSFFIFDENCTIKGAFSPHQTNDCSSPYVIEENFLKYVLTVTSLNYGPVEPYFSFLYANKNFSIGDNGCGCEETGGGLEAVYGCKCVFPVNGFLQQAERRSIEVPFQA